MVVTVFQTRIKVRDEHSEPGFRRKAHLGERCGAKGRVRDEQTLSWDIGLCWAPAVTTLCFEHLLPIQFLLYSLGPLFLAHEMKVQVLTLASGHGVYFTQCRVTVFSGHPPLWFYRPVLFWGVGDLQSHVGYHRQVTLPWDRVSTHCTYTVSSVGPSPFSLPLFPGHLPLCWLWRVFC